MLDTLDPSDHAAVQQWIALADDVAHRQRDLRAYQTRGESSVAQALDRLVAYEHQLPAYLRLLAREVVFQRDFPALSLPQGRDWWAQCQCRTCVFERRRTRSDRRAAVYDVQLAAVRRQRS